MGWGWVVGREHGGIWQGSIRTASQASPGKAGRLARAGTSFSYTWMPFRKTCSFKYSLWSCRRMGVWFIGEKPMAGRPTCEKGQHSHDYWFTGERSLFTTSFNTLTKQTTVQGWQLLTPQDTCHIWTFFTIQKYTHFNSQRQSRTEHPLHHR